MNKYIVQKLKSLPKTSGVYLYRDKDGKVIYVGKAVNLKNRVSSYFNNQEKDPKTVELVKNIVKLDTIETGSEFEALILESDLVKRYNPKYNVRLKDDKGYVYLKMTKEDYPRISVVHGVADEKAEYMGPYIDSNAVRNILKIARRIFPYCSCGKKGDDVCLYFHLNLCPGHSPKYISKADYAKNIRGIKKLFAGQTEKLKKEFQKGMKVAAKSENFEQAANFRDQLKNLERIERSHFISERDLAADIALVQLQKALGLDKIPARVECYDISNIMGTAAVGSMVVFKNGIASPKDYRRFQIRTVKGANDFAMLAEVLNRRFKTREKRKEKREKSVIGPTQPLNSFHNSLNSDLPDLVILDGGKGQLSTVIKNVQIPKSVKVVALAKRKEEIFSLINNKSQAPNNKQIPNLKLTNSDLNRNSKPARPAGGFEIRNLPSGSESYFLVQRIRDEAHRFAITYHHKVKSREMYETSLDAIPGVGPKTKKKLLREFGSIQKIREVDEENLSRITSAKLAKIIKESL
jgi:excinuclease ABC subunit C